MDLGKATAILDTAHNAFVSMDEAGRVTYWNPRAQEIFGWSREEALGQAVSELIIPDAYRAAHVEGLAHFLSSGEGPVLGRRTELSALRRGGEEFPVELTISALADDEGGWSFHAFVQDVSERRRAEQERADLVAQLEALARTDSLTGAANRRSLDEELRREVARCSRSGQGLTILMLDLDHFKAFNDRQGHQAGDALLRDVAIAWRRCLRETDLLARYGGDEFSVLLPACPPRNSEEVVARLTAATADLVAFSTGAATWHRGDTPEALLARADSALYEAKHNRGHHSVQHSGEREPETEVPG